MEGLELAAFNIISQVGTARSCYIEAIQKAKEGAWGEVDQLFADGDEAYNAGHEAHLEVLGMEAEGQISGPNMLMLHAEDQLMSAEGFKIIATEFIDIYKKLQALEAK